VSHGSEAINKGEDMETDVLEIETTEIKQNQLVKIVETSGLEKTKADYILQKFTDYFKIASEWEVKAKVLAVTSETQVAEMKMAREGRLFLKEKRIDIERARKELKEQSLREGKAIDGIANVLKALIVPIEGYLEEQEKFIELREDRKKEDRKSERIAELQTLGVDITIYDLKNMPEDSYNALVAGTKLAIQQKIEAEKKAEEERIAREKEQERIRMENERLKKEAEEREKQVAQERAKAEAEKHALEEVVRKEREKAEQEARRIKLEQDAKLKKEREEREKVETQLRVKAEAEEREQKRIEDEKKKAQKAPDKQKLIALIEKINALELPDVKSAEAKKIVDDARGLLNKVVKFINERAENM